MAAPSTLETHTTRREWRAVRPLLAPIAIISFFAGLCRHYEYLLPVRLYLRVSVFTGHLVLYTFLLLGVAVPALLARASLRREHRNRSADELALLQHSASASIYRSKLAFVVILSYLAYISCLGGSVLALVLGWHFRPRFITHITVDFSDWLIMDIFSLMSHFLVGIPATAILAFYCYTRVHSRRAWGALFVAGITLFVMIEAATWIFSQSLTQEITSTRQYRYIAIASLEHTVAYAIVLAFPLYVMARYSARNFAKALHP